MEENKDKLELEEINEEVKEEIPEEEKSEVPEEKEGEVQEEGAAEIINDDEAEEEVKVYTPHEKEPPALISERKEPELGRKDIAPAVQYRKSMEREKKIAQEVKKRQRRPMVFVLVMCALLIVIAIIVNAVMKDFDTGYTHPTEAPAASQTPESSAVAAEAPQPQQTPTPVVQGSREPGASSFEVYVEDISWEAARDKCAQMGGRLAVINDLEEYEQVMEVIKNVNANKLWIGCYKYDGAIVWLDGEASSYYPWAANEPSGFDGYDGAAEDYIMLWRYNEGWLYNDNRNDPVGTYPQYSGTVGYICEYN